MRISLAAGILFVSAMLVAGPFVTADNPLAAGLYALLTTVIATAIGIWAGRVTALSTDRERLTRYGLQAWRQIDALSVKVLQQISHGQANSSTLESWLLDIDQAKLGWQDLLKEVFDLQQRLQLEQEEVSQSYKKKIAATQSMAERQNLEEQRRLDIAKIAAKAPLPFTSSESVDCLHCGASINFDLSSTVGATAHANCPACNSSVPVHRRSDTEVYVSADAIRIPTATVCAHCGAAQNLRVSPTKTVEFNHACTSCNQVSRYKGNHSGLTAEKVLQ